MRFATLFLLAMGFAASVSAQTFSSSDLDENGWLWLNTSAKISKYISEADASNMAINTGGTVIQTMKARWGDSEGCYAAADLVGVGTDGVLGGANAKTGGIRIPGGGTSMMYRALGGSFAIRMNSCGTLSLFLSSESNINVYLKGSKSESTSFDAYTDVCYNYSTTKLAAAGQKEWTGIEKLKADMSLESSSPVVAYYINTSSNKYVYLHGIKLTEYGSVTSLEGLPADNQLGMVMMGQTLSLRANSNVKVYSLTGSCVLEAKGDMIDLSGLAKGVYIVKAQSGVAQQTQKVTLK